MSTNEIPRRNRMDQWTPAEKAIHEAAQAVEAAGAHPRLTDAVILLGQAREAVADFVDRPGPFSNPALNQVYAESTRALEAGPIAEVRSRPKSQEIKGERGNLAANGTDLATMIPAPESEGLDLEAERLVEAFYEAVMGYSLASGGDAHLAKRDMEKARENLRRRLRAGAEGGDVRDLDAIEAALTVANRKTDIFDAAWAAVRRLRSSGSAET